MTNNTKEHIAKIELCSIQLQIRAVKLIKGYVTEQYRKTKI